MTQESPQKIAGTVLLIEDNFFMSELLAEKLARQDLATARAKDGAEGLKLTAMDQPTAAVLDFPLAGDLSGVEVVQGLRKLFDHDTLPILVLFNRDNAQEIKACMDAGANGYIIKSSVNTDEIIAYIQEVIAKKTISFVPADQQPAPETDAKHNAAPEEPAPAILAQLKIKIEEMLKMPEAEISIIALVEDMINYAFLARASDIHLEPFENTFLARMRIDGLLYDVFSFPKSIQSGILTRIKVLGGMRTDEHQAAQDGRFKITLTNPPREFDMRVSIIPTYYAENAVLRLLAEQTKIKRLKDLGITPADLKKITDAVAKPYGMVLATGPTGSGKTTMLYTVLKELNTREVSIITIEDPIEYSLEGIDQIQVNARTGLTFAAGLRSILRQDPNIIMVGEIRDEETASIAVNAALTGHKLLSTLHTNDAATTLPRLLDMGVEPFLVASTVNAAIGQRLVRMLCQNCKVQRRITDAEFARLVEVLPKEVLDDHKDFYFGQGCEQCGHGGYFDRIGVYEVLEMNDFIREAIMRHGDASEIRKIAIKNGMTTLLEDGFRKALAGLTTIEEILRVVHE